MFKRLIASLVCLTFIFSNIQSADAQDFSINQLPVPGTMVGESAPFSPLALKGLIVNPQKPLEFQFIVDTGLGPQDTASIKDQANQLVKYFLAGLTIPEGDLWVNLSPYEKDRMVPEALGQTDLGRDLLAQDYILKQLTASLIYPEKDLGKEFWSRVYAKAQEQFGTTNIPVNTFNKVWILPDQAQVYENVNAAYVTKSTLKVMLDEDYMALQKHGAIESPSSGVIASEAKQSLSINKAHTLASQIVRAIILPEIEKEVNTGKNFAPLRQIYQALILAKWYKETIQNGLLDAVYTNKDKVAGVNVKDPAVKEEIYQRYLRAYKKGAFNYIKDDSTLDGQVVPRKYFSGGIPMQIELKRTQDPALIGQPDGAMLSVVVTLAVAAGAALGVRALYRGFKKEINFQRLIDGYIQGISKLDSDFYSYLDSISMIDVLLNDKNDRVRLSTRLYLNNIVKDKWLQYQLGFVGLISNYPEVKTWAAEMIAKSGKKDIGPVYERTFQYEQKGHVAAPDPNNPISLLNQNDLRLPDFHSVLREKGMFDTEHPFDGNIADMIISTGKKYVFPSGSTQGGYITYSGVDVEQTYYVRTIIKMNQVISLKGLGEPDATLLDYLNKPRLRLAAARALYIIKPSDLTIEYFPEEFHFKVGQDGLRSKIVDKPERFLIKSTDKTWDISADKAMLQRPEKDAAMVVVNKEFLKKTNTSKYKLDFSGKKFVAIPFPGVSIIDDLNIVSGRPEGESLKYLLSEKVKTIKSLAIVNEDLKDLLKKIAFVPDDSFHATILDLIAIDYKTASGQPYEKIRPIIEGAVNAMLSDRGIQRDFEKLFKGIQGKVVGVDAFPAFLKFNIEISKEDLELFTQFREVARARIREALLSQSGAQDAENFSEKYFPSTLGFVPHITIGYVVNQLTQNEVEALSLELNKINQHFVPIPIRLTAGKLMQFNDMETYKDLSMTSEAMNIIRTENFGNYEDGVRQAVETIALHGNAQDKQETINILAHVADKTYPWAGKNERDYSDVNESLRPAGFFDRNYWVQEVLFAIEMLGVLGDLRAIEPLQELTQKSGMEAEFIAKAKDIIGILQSKKEMVGILRGNGKDNRVNLESLVGITSELELDHNGHIFIDGEYVNYISKIGRVLSYRGIVIVDDGIGELSFYAVQNNGKVLRLSPEDVVPATQGGDDVRWFVFHHSDHHTLSGVSNMEIKGKEMIFRAHTGKNPVSKFPVIIDLNKLYEHLKVKYGGDLAMLQTLAHKTDKAALALPPGGIDLNQINVNRTGKTVNVQFDQAQLNALTQGGFEGFAPVIINITPISSPFQLLGIAKEPEGALAKV